MTKVKITVDNKELNANFNDSDTSKELISRFPLNLEMLNLYSREMTYRFPEKLPAKKAKTSSYESGDIAYWAPRHSFVIFYKQTGEIIDELQKIGHITSDLSFLNKSGNLNMNFQLIK
ncbi:cyclophilin-like fold protein [Companilactobacillus kimchiensis]|uniref:Cyclophilin-like domain-containing protein n=1 Tax=Companilactobacillus kimchiensis TaxID=993692 RepID=A0A0R2LFN4_9LACO|nr:cyclophilin-like fold protein [Companilactobacillus kimchiensis]KRO00601.1 hypothetical protein IV57_GL001039 [Companilactobacillus kimchiensis]